MFCNTFSGLSAGSPIKPSITTFRYNDEHHLFNEIEERGSGAIVRSIVKKHSGKETPVRLTRPFGALILGVAQSRPRRVG
jgi:hypothetical protein